MASKLRLARHQLKIGVGLKRGHNQRFMTEGKTLPDWTVLPRPIRRPSPGPSPHPMGRVARPQRGVGINIRIVPRCRRSHKPTRPARNQPLRDVADCLPRNLPARCVSDPLAVAIGIRSRRTSGRADEHAIAPASRLGTLLSKNTVAFIAPIAIGVLQILDHATG
jgi:hypothetical protein